MKKKNKEGKISHISESTPQKHPQKASKNKSDKISQLKNSIQTSISKTVKKK